MNTIHNDGEVVRISELAIALNEAGEVVGKQCTDGMNNTDEPEIPPELGLTSAFRIQLNKMLLHAIKTVKGIKENQSGADFTLDFTLLNDGNTHDCRIYVQAKRVHNDAHVDFTYKSQNKANLTEQHKLLTDAVKSDINLGTGRAPFAFYLLYGVKKADETYGVRFVNINVLTTLLDNPDLIGKGVTAINTQVYADVIGSQVGNTYLQNWDVAGPIVEALEDGLNLNLATSD